MATAEQIKSLIRSFYSEDQEGFYTVALQVAAHEAKRGHSTLAFEIRELVNLERKSSRKKLNVISFPKDLKGLVLTENSDTPKSALTINSEIAERIYRIIHEYKQKNKLKQHGLSHRRKILLAGPPGTGKTLTAKVLSHELNLPLNTIQADRLVTKFMGETSAKLRQIFDLVKQENGVYLFDEFDAIGGERTLENDVGEMRRVLNSFLQFIEQDQSDSLIVAVTNNPNLLDSALFRRFDDVLYYELPKEKERKQLMKNTLGTFLPSRFAWIDILASSEGLSHSEIDHACRDSIKESILEDKPKVLATDLLEAINNRKNVYIKRQ